MKLDFGSKKLKVIFKEKHNDQFIKNFTSR